MYSISLKAKDENTFATDKKVMVNETYVNSANVTNSGTKLFVVAIKTIKPKTVIYQHISEVEINNATISFKVGDKPIFSGTTPENVPYIYQSEYWSTDGGNKYYYAADFGTSTTLMIYLPNLKVVSLILMEYILRQQKDIVLQLILN